MDALMQGADVRSPAFAHIRRRFTSECKVLFESEPPSKADWKHVVESVKSIIAGDVDDRVMPTTKNESNIANAKGVNCTVIERRYVLSSILFHAMDNYEFGYDGGVLKLPVQSYITLITSVDLTRESVSKILTTRPVVIERVCRLLLTTLSSLSSLIVTDVRERERELWCVLHRALLSSHCSHTMLEMLIADLDNNAIRVVHPQAQTTILRALIGNLWRGCDQTPKKMPPTLSRVWASKCETLQAYPQVAEDVALLFPMGASHQLSTEQYHQLPALIGGANIFPKHNTTATLRDETEQSSNPRLSENTRQIILTVIAQLVTKTWAVGCCFCVDKHEFAYDHWNPLHVYFECIVSIINDGAPRNDIVSQLHKAMTMYLKHWNVVQTKVALVQTTPTSKPVHPSHLAMVYVDGTCGGGGGGGGGTRGGRRGGGRHGGGVIVSGDVIVSGGDDGGGWRIDGEVKDGVAEIDRLLATPCSQVLKSTTWLIKFRECSMDLTTTVRICRSCTLLFYIRDTCLSSNRFWEPFEAVSEIILQAYSECASAVQKQIRRYCYNNYSKTTSTQTRQLSLAMQLSPFTTDMGQAKLTSFLNRFTEVSKHSDQFLAKVALVNPLHGLTIIVARTIGNPDLHNLLGVQLERLIEWPRIRLPSSNNVSLLSSIFQELLRDEVAKGNTSWVDQCFCKLINTWMTQSLLKDQTRCLGLLITPLEVVLSCVFPCLPSLSSHGFMNELFFSLSVLQTCLNVSQGVGWLRYAQPFELLDALVKYFRAPHLPSSMVQKLQVVFDKIVLFLCNDLTPIPHGWFENVCALSSWTTILRLRPLLQQHDLKTPLHKMVFDACALQNSDFQIDLSNQEDFPTTTQPTNAVGLRQLATNLLLACCVSHEIGAFLVDSFLQHQHQTNLAPPQKQDVMMLNESNEDVIQSEKPQDDGKLISHGFTSMKWRESCLHAMILLLPSCSTSQCGILLAESIGLRLLQYGKHMDPCFKISTPTTSALYKSDPVNIVSVPHTNASVDTTKTTTVKQSGANIDRVEVIELLPVLTSTPTTSRTASSLSLSSPTASSFSLSSTTASPLSLSSTTASPLPSTTASTLASPPTPNPATITPATTTQPTTTTSPKTPLTIPPSTTIQSTTIPTMTQSTIIPSITSLPTSSITPSATSPPTTPLTTSPLPPLSTTPPPLSTTPLTASTLPATTTPSPFTTTPSPTLTSTAPSTTTSPPSITTPSTMSTTPLPLTTATPLTTSSSTSTSIPSTTSTTIPSSLTTTLSTSSTITSTPPPPTPTTSLPPPPPPTTMLSTLPDILTTLSTPTHIDLDSLSDVYSLCWILVVLFSKELTIEVMDGIQKVLPVLTQYVKRLWATSHTQPPMSKPNTPKTDQHTSRTNNIETKNVAPPACVSLVFHLCSLVNMVAKLEKKNKNVKENAASEEIAPALEKAKQQLLIVCIDLLPNTLRTSIIGQGTLDFKFVYIACHMEATLLLPHSQERDAMRKTISTIATKLL